MAYVLLVFGVIVCIALELFLIKVILNWNIVSEVISDIRKSPAKVFFVPFEITMLAILFLLISFVVEIPIFFYDNTFPPFTFIHEISNDFFNLSISVYTFIVEFIISLYSNYADLTMAVKLGLISVGIFMFFSLITILLYLLYKYSKKKAKESDKVLKNSHFISEIILTFLTLCMVTLYININNKNVKIKLISVNLKEYGTIILISVVSLAILFSLITLFMSIRDQGVVGGSLFFILLNGLMVFTHTVFYGVLLVSIGLSIIIIGVIIVRYMLGGMAIDDTIKDADGHVLRPIGTTSSGATLYRDDYTGNTTTISESGLFNTYYIRDDNCTKIQK